MFARLVSSWPTPDDVDVDKVLAVSPEGHEVRCRSYRLRGSTSRTLVVYAHGGGMISCNLDTHDPICRRLAHETGAGVLSVDLRLAPEYPFPAAVVDVFTALQWAASGWHAHPDRIAIMGDSAGGGIAAGVSLMARDRQAVQPMTQILVYPMLDDRTRACDPDVADFLMWSPDDNVTAWGCLLGPVYGTEDVSPYAAPARASDVSGLPRVYIDVGDLDLYCDEVSTYASRLRTSGVEVEFHCFEGAPHAFDLFAPDSNHARSAWHRRLQFIRSLDE
jgi:acetyl esterase/lipase